MARENWEQEVKIIDAFKPAYDALFNIETALTPELRRMVYGVRCELGRVENQCRLEVREVERNGSSVWATLRTKEEK